MLTNDVENAMKMWHFLCHMSMGGKSWPICVGRWREGSDLLPFVISSLGAETADQSCEFNARYIALSSTLTLLKKGKKEEKNLLEVQLS